MSATTTATETLPSQTLSTAQPAPPSGPVTAVLNFYNPPADGAVPYNFVEPQTDGKQSNFTAVPHEVRIQDIRGQEQRFEIDKHAFLPLLSSEATRSSKADFSDDDSIKRTYYPEVEKLLLDNLPGSHRVFIFDHTVRRAHPGAKRGPVTRTHIDQTPDSAAERVRVHMGDEADALLAGRFRIVNTWRPLNGAIESHPLAVADSSSVADADLVPVEHRYPQRTGYTAAVRHTDAMRWWYWSAMDNDERLLLQCWDSKSRTRLPHSAFEDPRSTSESKPRESIEVRALVFG